jgi:hypothetical protein
MSTKAAPAFSGAGSAAADFSPRELRANPRTIDDEHRAGRASPGNHSRQDSRR